MSKTLDESSLRTAMRRLWSDHAIWTRQYIVAAVAGTPDAQAAATRLLRNQEDIGGAVAGFYGKEAGDALTSLLKRHITIAVDLVAAANDGNKILFGIRDRQWTKNARDIATFLSQANPYWTRKDVFDLLELHLDLTKREAVARITSDWDDDVAAFDEIFAEILTLADALSTGIVRQFADPALAS
jgi:hypothetical protein